jgi:RHS repeat-associated protein
MTTTTLPSGTGIVSTYAYDNADRLTGISHVKNGSTTVASVAYTLDDVGNRTQRVDQQGTHTYAYDDLHRLISVTYPGPSTTTSDFDAFGNRTEMTVGSDTTTYSYDDADRLTTVTPPSPASAISYTWDDNGNLTDRGSDSFSWDYEDRMVSATVNSVTTTFAYRGDGLRNSRTVGGNTTTFTWDIASGLPVVLDDGNQYVYGAGLTSMKQSGSWYYYLADGLGSTMAIVDASGNSQKSYQYDVYGEVTGGSGSLTNEFDFAGQQTDGTGLQYLRARYYDPETGVFLSRDPMAAGNGWLGHGHSYANGAPTLRSDPAGLRPEDGGESNWSCASGCWLWSPEDSIAIAELGGATVILPNGFWFELWHVGNEPPNQYRVCRFVGEYKRCSDSDEDMSDWWSEQLGRINTDRVLDFIDDIFGVLGIHKPGRLGDRRAQCIQDRYGVYMHDLKDGLGAGFDLFIDALGDIVIKRKSGSGPGDPTGRNMDEFPGC